MKARNAALDFQLLVVLAALHGDLELPVIWNCSPLHASRLATEPRERSATSDNGKIELGYHSTHRNDAGLIG